MVDAKTSASAPPRWHNVSITTLAQRINMESFANFLPASPVSL
jgi:hypothetical protein